MWRPGIDYDHEAVKGSINFISENLHQARQAARTWLEPGQDRIVATHNKIAGRELDKIHFAYQNREIPPLAYHAANSRYYKMRFDTTRIIRDIERANGVRAGPAGRPQSGMRALPAPGGNFGGPAGGNPGGQAGGKFGAPAGGNFGPPAGGNRGAAPGGDFGGAPGGGQAGDAGAPRGGGGGGNDDLEDDFGGD
ncbi:hypothetical protein EJ08DRAFT_658812 [Tothia fuscella]|uniref:Uncharacterized protein n=1 Tax=Tothia fuscella TaxID=1048955 RepID=A0A9P4U1A9_9PEZI|nr:hypothetical protein EJ08DRAFT_658812 [Tothia fuscella]